MVGDLLNVVRDDTGSRSQHICLTKANKVKLFMVRHITQLYAK